MTGNVLYAPWLIRKSLRRSLIRAGIRFIEHRGGVFEIPDRADYVHVCKELRRQGRAR